MNTRGAMERQNWDAMETVLNRAVQSRVDRFNDGFVRGLKISGTLFCCYFAYELVAMKYRRYVNSKRKLERSEGLIEILQQIPELDRDRSTKRSLDNAQKKRKAAAEYLEKHKFAAKLVEMFPPKIRGY